MKAARVVVVGSATVVGAAAWLAVGAATGRREAWDGSEYYVIVMPLLALASGALGYAAPGSAFLIAYAIALGQFSALLAKNGLGSLFPIGMVVFLVLALPNWAAAWAGGRLRTGRAAE